MGKSWRQIGDRIAKMSADEQKEEATIFVEALDAYYSVDAIEVADEDGDGIDDGQLYLAVMEEAIDEDDDEDDDTDDVEDDSEELEESEL